MGPEVNLTTRVELLKSLPSRDELVAHLGFKPEKFLFIVDRKLKQPFLRQWLKQFTAVYWVKAGEELKDLRKFSKHVEAMMKSLGPSSPHSLVVVGVGGGTIGDFAGFFASIFKRGIPLIQMPTTFLAAVDSAHGGKNGLSVAGIKNQVGTFHQPRVVYAVQELLKDLPEKQCHAALGEFAKMALISGEKLFAELERMPGWNFEELWRLLPQAIEAKNEIVRRDPFETKGERQHLNLGHTFGHALEAQYQLAHGEAVALGLVFAVQWSQHRGYLPQAAEERILYLLNKQLKIPTAANFFVKHRRMSRERLAHWLADDKKLIDQRHVRFVFLDRIGGLRRTAVPLESMLTEAERQGWLKG
ncbi:MAG: 3-dehydroquinate synthase family protein [Bdellovibrionales bacterium]